MIVRILGALLILTGCGAVGYSTVRVHRSTVQQLKWLEKAVQEMLWELKYRVSPLTELCRAGAMASKGEIRQMLTDLAARLEEGDCYDPGSCLLGLAMGLPRQSHRVVQQMAVSLGRFELEGQIQALTAALELCREERREMEEGSKERLRLCRTMALCAGAALVILFI